MITARIAPPDPEHPLYKLWHTRAIGASAAAAVLGKDYFQTTRELWEYITKRRQKDPQTPAMLEGLAMEPKIWAEWEWIVGTPGEPANLIDAEHDFLRAQIDWLSYDSTRAAEFKWTRSERVWASARKKVLPDFWKPQAQHKLMVLGLQAIDWYVWSEIRGNRDYVQFLVERDDAYIAMLRAREVKFWTKYVRPDIAPPERRLRLRMERNAL